MQYAVEHGGWVGVRHFHQHASAWQMPAYWKLVSILEISMHHGSVNMITAAAGASYQDRAALLAGVIPV